MSFRELMSFVSINQAQAKKEFGELEGCVCTTSIVVLIALTVQIAKHPPLEALAALAYRQ